MKSHTVIKGDRLGDLAIRYLGSWAKWLKIRDANPQLKGRKTASDGSPLIFPGEILIIPLDNEKKSTIPTEIDAPDDAITLTINGNKFQFFNNYELVQEIDSFDSLTVTVPFDVDLKIYRDNFRPFSYTPVQVYYGKNIFFNGTLIAPQSLMSANASTISLTACPICEVINDCTLPISKYPIEFNKQNLKQIAESVTSPFGFSVDFPDSPGNKFEKVALEPEKKILEFLIELAEQRGFLITNNAEGNLKFWKSGSEIVDNIKSGESKIISCQPNFNPQEFYSHITGLIKATKSKKAQKYTVINDYLVKKGVTRSYNFSITDAESGDVQQGTKIKAAKMFGNSCSYELTLQGHFNKNKSIWTKNTCITLYAPKAMVYKDTKFLIKRSRMTRNSSSGDSTVLDLVLPESYSGTMPGVMPWEE